MKSPEKDTEMARGKTVMGKKRKQITGKTMKKVVKVTSYGKHPMYVHAAYDRSGNVIRYFLLNYLAGAAPVDSGDVKGVMKIAKAEAIARGFDEVHVSTMEYKPKRGHDMMSPEKDTEMAREKTGVGKKREFTLR